MVSNVWALKTCSRMQGCSQVTVRLFSTLSDWTRAESSNKSFTACMETTALRGSNVAGFPWVLLMEGISCPTATKKYRFPDWLNCSSRFFGRKLYHVYLLVWMWFLCRSEENSLTTRASRASSSMAWRPSTFAVRTNRGTVASLAALPYPSLSCLSDRSVHSFKSFKV